MNKRYFTCRLWRSAVCALIPSAIFFTACSDFFEPVESTAAPTEYSFNYWLLQKTYLFEDELPLLDEQGDSVSELYGKLSDPYTRYVPPSKSEEAITHINTSIVPGDVGMEYTQFMQMEHPIVIYRVYAESPAGRAGIKRYGNILSVNGVDLTGESAFNDYETELAHNKEISITIAYSGDTTTYELVKEDVYAPTVFVDTLSETEIITITGFKLNTVDKKNGTLGELKTHLESSKDSKMPGIIDLRNNPGGHVNHCTSMADLFIKEGAISTRSWRSFAGDGTPLYNKLTVVAKPGDAGEKRKFVVLVNGGSASCAEIFAIALQEGAKIPVAGTVTYGKGIGQSTWKTLAGGLSLITNLEFLSPEGNSYHKKGIIPNYPCEMATLQCGLDAVKSKYGTPASQKKVLKKSTDDLYASEPQILRRYKDFGGAIIEGDKQ